MRPGRLGSWARRPAPSTWLAAAVFVGALLSRTVWLREVYFHPDGSTVLWGSKISYLREVLVEGRGLQEATDAGAFDRREGSPCERA